MAEKASHDKPLNIKKIRKYLEKELDPKRYEHTLGVAYIAAALAMRYEADLYKAELAGMLHDCAKCMSNEKKLLLCRKNGMEITAIELKNPFLLHAKAGSLVARKKFHIQDQDILNAVKSHTTGRPCMSVLEKIVFIADYIEPGRKNAPGLQEIRKLAFENLDACLYRILEDTLAYLRDQEGDIDPMTENTYQYYKGYMDKMRGGEIHEQSGA